MFGKPYADYIRYQMPLLVAILVVGLLRLVLSTAGQPNSVVKYVSMTVVALVGVVYYGLRVGPSGFGGYKQLLPLIFNQAVIANGIAILGIGVSAMGLPNIYDAPEFRGPGGGPDTSPLAHAMAHLFIGTTVGTLVSRALGCLVMRVAGRPPRK